MKKRGVSGRSCTLRAKIDMASQSHSGIRSCTASCTPSITARQSLVHLSHYDWRTVQCDSIEGITHSICTLELKIIGRSMTGISISSLFHPQQIEFDRLNLTYSK